MSDNNNNQSGYTFWAEQVNPEGSPNMNPGYSYQESQPYQGNNPYQQMNSFQPNNFGQGSAALVPPKKKKKAKKFFGFLGKAAVFGLIAGLTFYGSNLLIDHFTNDGSGSGNHRFTLGNNNLNLDRPSNVTIPSTTISTNVNTQSTDVSEVVADTLPSIVTITSTFNTSYNMWGYEYGGESTGGGSGIIIGQKDNTLYIATNNHVVDGAVKIMISFIDGSEAEAQIRGRNASADLAVITIDTTTMTKEALSSIKVAKLGNSDDVKVGQMSIAIGNALGYGQSVTVGYISAKGREIKVDANTTLNVLQTDAAINPGNSGGALINMKGEVIGINSAKFSQTDVEGIGYAIPISIAYPIVDELMNREILTDTERGYLGLYPSDVNESVAAMYEWPIGVYVYSLVEGGAAQKAGIYVGDIITSINNITVSSSEQLRDTVNSYRYGTTVTVTLMRFSEGEYHEMTFDVVLQQNTDNTDKTTEQPSADSNPSDDKEPFQDPITIEPDTGDLNQPVHPGQQPPQDKRN